MPLNKCKGDMFNFVTHTWNPIKGICPHGCSYCYAHGINNYMPKLDEKEFKTNLLGNAKIFIGSSIDMWADKIPDEWIKQVLIYCQMFPRNEYYFFTKNPKRYRKFSYYLDRLNRKLCATIETNRHYPQVMGSSPYPMSRGIRDMDIISIEPVMQFDLNSFVDWLMVLQPKKDIWIGANSKREIPIPEPKLSEVEKLKTRLEKNGLSVHLKDTIRFLK